MKTKKEIREEIRWHDRCIDMMKEKGLQEGAKEHTQQRTALEWVLDVKVIHFDDELRRTESMEKGRDY